jgi:hypothetical protein
MSEVAEEISRRLRRLFLRDAEGRRAVLGDRPELQADPRFKDLVAFHEYFHGDNGRGLGAAHQTGWTGLIALLIQPRLPALDGMMPVAHSMVRPLSGGPGTGLAVAAAGG